MYAVGVKLGPSAIHARSTCCWCRVFNGSGDHVAIAPLEDLSIHPPWKAHEEAIGGNAAVARKLWCRPWRNRARPRHQQGNARDEIAVGTSACRSAADGTGDGAI